MGAKRNWLIWLAVVPVLAWTAVRMLGLDSGFPLVALMAFTPYVAIAAFLVFGLAAALENWAAAAACALATFCLALAVLPRAIGDGTVSASGRETIGALSVNAHFGTVDPEALVALVARLEPDVLSVQELSPKLAAALEREGIGRLLPHSALAVAEEAAGTGIYSTLPLTRMPAGPHLFFRMPRARAALPGGGTLRIVAVHPLTPGRTGIGAWEAALSSLPTTGDGAPWILVGDFNATLDHAQLRDVVNRGYRDAGAVAGEGLKPTWPAGRWDDRSPPITIDHVLLDRRLDVVEYSVESLPETDHHPIYARLALP
ncbi:MAG TPA: endonuclease/exonuclease/phosphatase family protein [Solirubrobacterales bacterium]|nr:endonuclease/exonuclease/phosphatase family protein [Solirubrobacterales bacterium]